MDRKEAQGAGRSAAPQSRLPSRPRGRPSESGDVVGQKNTCPICFNGLTDICAYQPCTHVLCFECAIRNRVLCNQKSCPVCRADSDQVVLAGHRFNDESDNAHRFDVVLKTAENQGRSDPCYGFIFETTAIERAYRKLLTHSCRFCDRPFSEFDELVRHVRERHDHHYCNVCVRTLMLFTWEHKVYMYDELLRHMDEGDAGDKNIQAHPLCELCAFRAFDKDDLYRHSKKRHQVCWICERTSNKLVFFNDFFTLYEHMAHLHYVCKLCSRPESATVVSFPDEQGLQIHMASDHSDGNIRADVLFNFQQHRVPERGGGGGGRQRRGQQDDRHDRHEEDEENSTRGPAQQNFNMDSAQFPTLGAAPPGGGPPPPPSQTGSSQAVGGETPQTVLKYGPPRLNENEFPSLVGGASKGKGASGAGAASTWTNGSAKVAAPAYTRKLTAEAPKKMTRSMPVSVAAPVAASDAFPALSGPAPTAVAKLNRDWTAVPMKNAKNKKGEQGKASSSQTETKAASTERSRWDLPEEDAPDSSPRKFQQQPEPSGGGGGASGQQVFVQRNHKDTGGGFDATQDLFPSLEKPEGKALPSLFRSAPSNKNKKVQKTAALPTKPVKKLEKDVIAETLFHTPSQGVFAREVSLDEGLQTDTSPSHTMATTVTHSTPYAMKADDFPGLEKAKPKAKIFVPERRPDRVQKHKEVKSEWGNTLVQYETVFVFIPPPNAEERRDALKKKVEGVQVKGKMKMLEDFQRELLEEKIPPLEFWMESQRLMGKGFSLFMPEVVVLLPNVALQQEMFDVAKVPIYGNVQVVKALVQCAVCKQIVRLGKDKEHHDAVHKSSR